jgi:hypothetical protein
MTDAATGIVVARSGDPFADGLAFRRGWYASTAPEAPEVTRRWAAAEISGVSVRIHPVLDHARAESPQATVLVLGQLLDTSAGTDDQHLIVAGVLAAAERGWDALFRCLARLAGRFVVIARRGEDLVVVPDTAATMSIHWTIDGGNLHLASHDALVAEATGAAADGELAQVLAVARRESPWVVYAPGARSLHRGVRPVLPNHALEWNGTTARHRRFYPFPDTRLPVDAYDSFVHHFTEHCRLLARGRPVTVALTGGRDSRASFAALRRTHRVGLSAWTSVSAVAPPASEVDDARSAAAMCAVLGVPHRVVAVSGEREAPEFAEAIARTFPVRTQVRALAASVHRDLAPDATSIQSMIAEVGSGFYLGRPLLGADAAALARVYSSRPIGTSPYAIEAFEEFIEYAEFHPDRFGPWGQHDIQYWEHRLPLWAALRFQELDLSHRVELPFNSRQVLEALASADPRTRKGKYFLQAYEQGY